jgi:hypothetical protein
VTKPPRYSPEAQWRHVHTYSGYKTFLLTPEKTASGVSKRSSCLPLIMLRSAWRSTLKSPLPSAVHLPFTFSQWKFVRTETTVGIAAVCYKFIPLNC